MIKKLVNYFENLIEEKPKINEDFSEKCIEAFENRRSIRNFKKDNIDEEIIYNILKCGLTAPCAGNIQSYNIIRVENKDLKEKIAENLFDQSWIINSPILFIIVKNESKLIEQFGKEEGIRFADQNCSLVAANIMLMSEVYNLGSCFVGAFKEDGIKKVLKIKPKLKVHSIIPIGYKNEKPQEIEKDKIATKIFYEKFGEKFKIRNPEKIFADK